MSNVTLLPGVGVKPTEPDERVISIIRGLLEKAESGEIRSIAAICTLNDGGRLSAFATRGIPCMEMLGGIHLLSHEYIEREKLLEE